MPPKVWFNQGFSIRNALELIRRDAGSAIGLLASSRKANAPALFAADTRFVEPQFPPGVADRAAWYCDWCLETCREHGVALFVPGDWRMSLARRVDEFAEIGTRLGIAGSHAAMWLIEDKALFTGEAMQRGLPVARTLVARSEAELESHVAQLEAEGHKPCVKPVRGVNGAGYWRLSSSGSLFDKLMDPDARNLPTGVMAQAMREKPGAELLVMEYLPGPETSVDCLAVDGVVIAAVARRKEGSSQRILVEGEEIALAAKTVASFGLNGLLNVQMRLDTQGRQVLLEINPRMSGGCLYAALSGINLPYWYVAIELGLATPADIPAPSFQGLIASVPEAVWLEREDAFVTQSEYGMSP